jgi:hypothetical protein
MHYIHKIFCYLKTIINPTINPGYKVKWRSVRKECYTFSEVSSIRSKLQETINLGVITNLLSRSTRISRSFASIKLISLNVGASLLFF